MKILIISDAWHPQINGVVRTYENLIIQLEKRGHVIKVIGPADFPLSMPMLGYPEIKLTLAPTRRLIKMIKGETPDKIHISTEGPLGCAARKYCIAQNIPFSTSFHTQFPDYIAKRVGKYLPFMHNTTHNIAKKFVRNFHARSNIMMVATQSLEDTLIEWGFKNPMQRLTRGANLDLFHTGKKTMFNELKSPIALYVGRIAIEKSIEDFLEMKWHGSKVIIGDGPSRIELEAKYPDTHFLGTKTTEELAECYRSADVFVFPSRTDTFGMVIVEALACGLPVAAYNVTGPKDIIVNDNLGALDDDLATAAQKALKNGTPMQRTNHIKKHHTWETAAQQYEEALIKHVK